LPTRTPAKRSSESRRAGGFGALVLFALALGFAVHLLRSEEPAADERAPSSNAESPAPVAPVTERGAPRPAESEATPAAPSSGHPATPSVADLEAELAADPDAVVRSLTRALPRGEREAQRLKVLEVQALVKTGQIGTARARARDYFERWPNGPDTATLEQLTGAHPSADLGR
jgi:hypothetical protein